MRTVVIIQARMGSTRLPGKVLMDLGGKPVLAHVVERCKASGFPVVVATTWGDAEDGAIADWCESNSVDYFRGATDPLPRMVACAQQFDADVIVRVCADSPFLDSRTIEPMVNEIARGADYCAYRLPNGMPAILTSIAATCEAITRYCLEQELASLAETEDSQHVTRGIYTKPRQWVIKWLPIERAFRHFSCCCAVDTQHDLDMLREFMAAEGVPA